MSYASQSLQSFIHDTDLIKVKLADETLTTIGGKEHIKSSPSITMSFVLHVPNLSSNLLLVSSPIFYNK